MKPILTEIVKLALVETVVNGSQLTAAEKRELDRAVKHNYLSKGRGGPFPAIKTVYARPRFDFVADRECVVAEAMRLAEWEARHGYSGRGNCLNLDCTHGLEGHQ